MSHLRLPCAFLCLAASLLGALPLHATAPAVPSGLTVLTLGVNSFRVRWTDNSADESHFLIQARVQGDTVWNDLNQVEAVSGSGSTVESFQIIGELTNKIVQFRVQAVKTGPPVETSVTAAVNATATPASVTFGAPTGLAGTKTSGSITINWTDNANSEWGYEVELKEGAGAFTLLGRTNPNQTSGLVLGSLMPGTPYQVRVRGAKNSSPTLYTAYSNTLSLTTNAAVAPSNLTTSLSGENSVGLQYTGSNAGQTAYRIEYRLQGGTDWVSLGTVGGGATSVNPIAGFDPATDYEFRLLAVYGDPDGTHELSPPSNTAPATTGFNPPSTLQAQPSSSTQIALQWTDHSSVEGGFAIYARLAGEGEFQLLSYTDANATTSTVSSLSPGTAYDFQVAAAYSGNVPAGRNQIVYSARSATATATTRDSMTGPVYVEAVAGVVFQHDITTTAGQPLTNSQVTGLPAELTYDPVTRLITGTPAAPAVHECTVNLEFEGGWTTSASLTIRVLAPPVAVGVIPGQDLASGGTTSLPLAGYFSDPDAASAARVTTNLGAMDFVLFPAAAPNTVANFLTYANAGDYTGTVFHRSVPGFVVQGGAFRADPGTAANAFTAVPTRPPLVNEYSLSNVRATIAMAKLGGNPDSATNQFFVNLANNGPILNPQNGGFTVFGRVTQPGMAVADQMAALPRGNYTIKLDGTDGDFEDWPLTQASAQMDNSRVVQITGVASLPVLAYSLHDNTAPTVVSAIVQDNDLELQALRGGVATLTVRATDLDGNTVDQSFTVQVPVTYSEWIADHPPAGGEGKLTDGDGGGLNNLAEFAYLGLPDAPGDDAAAKPVFAKNSVNQLLSAEFNVRKGTLLTYRVHDASSLHPLTPSLVWDSQVDGFGAANVQVLSDHPTHTRIRVTGPAAPPGATVRFLTVEVYEP